MQSLITAARDWMAADPDPSTRAQTQALIDAEDADGLAECFGQRLQFGTAGIRGAMGPGPGRMNRALIRQVTAGLARYLLASQPDAAARGVVVGFDGRHLSDVFAADAAAVLTAAGIKVLAFSAVVATPVLAHAVTFTGAAAGVMVTASHNPPADNGYKVYWGNGAQIIPPHDAGISAAIDAIGSPGDVAVAASARTEPVPAAAWEDYVRRVLSWRVSDVTGARAVYTAMHGVGHAPLARLLEAAGHAPVIPVPEQRDPDGDFPTVAFPNPEEPGALALAEALATAQGVSLILANDPDADRLAVSLPDGDGGWKRLTGNEIGLLLAETLLAARSSEGPCMVATTVVSSSLLGHIAQAHQAQLVETLTGFKWIANAAIDFPGEFIVGFEEALGYSVGDVVRDKDGLSAALQILDLASRCEAAGRTLADALEDLYRRYGYAASSQRAIVLPGATGAARIAGILDRLRASPPAAVASIPVVQIRDLLTGTARDLRSGESSSLDLPASNVLAFDLAEGCRILARPSGTEPKIKFYFEVLMPLAAGEPLADARARAAARMSALEQDFLRLAGL